MSVARSARHAAQALTISPRAVTTHVASILHKLGTTRRAETARQRMAAILIRYGKAILDTPHPVARRADLAAMIGASRVMMGRALRDLEADGLVGREHGGGIRILDEARLAGLVTVASPDGSPAL